MTERRQLLIAVAGVSLVMALGATHVSSRGNGERVFARASELYEAQRYDEALRELASFPRGNGLAAEADFLAGKAKFKMGRFAEAESSFRMALSAEPWSLRFRMNLALSLYRQGKSKEAAGIYREVQSSGATTDPDLAERASVALRLAEGKPSAN